MTMYFLQTAKCRSHIIMKTNSLSIQFEEISLNDKIDLWLVPHRLIDPLNKG